MGVYDSIMKNLYKKKPLNVRMIKKLLSSSDFDLKDEKGYTPLLLAMEKGLYNKNYMQFAKSLIEKGADINAVSPEERGNTPLHLVVQTNYTNTEDFIKLLLEKGAKVDGVNKNGETPLMMFYGMQDNIVKLLLNYGADVNARTNYGYTVLMELVSGFCSESKKCSIAKILIEHGADVNATTGSGKSAVSLANEKFLPELARTLLSYRSKAASEGYAEKHVEKSEIALPEIKSLPLRLIDAATASKSGAGLDDFDTAIQESNLGNYSGCVAGFERAITKGLDALREGYAYAEMGEKKLLYLSEAGGAVLDFVKSLSYPEVFYETAHNAGQYLAVIYETAGAAGEAASLRALLVKAADKISYSLSNETIMKIKEKLKGITWIRR